MSAPVYITMDEIKASLSMQNQTLADEEITEAIATASRAVDKACDRKFYLGDLSETRFYTPRAPVSLEIDDLVNLESVTIDRDGDGVFETPWALHVDFELQPDNAAADGRPWERIVVKQQTSHNVFPAGLQRSVEVVGTFGWLTTPAAVVTLTRLLTVQLVMRTRTAPFGVIGFGVDGAVRIAREDPAMCLLLRDIDRSPTFA